MATALVSIIIPIYNGANYVEPLYRALEAQTYKDLEIIIVNDGSTDDTLAQLERVIPSGGGRYQVYSKENEGVSRARNFGLAKATGSFITFIDCDDYFFPEYIEHLVELIEANDADASTCRCYKMWDTEEMPSFDGQPITQVIYEGEEILQALLYRKYLTTHTYLKMYTRKAIEGVHFDEDLIYAEDFIFTFDALKNCQRVACSDRMLYIYYQHPTSAVHSIQNFRKLEAAWDVHESIIIAYANEARPDLLPAAYAKGFIFATDCACRVWRFKEEKEFKRRLVGFIRRVDSSVLKDKNAKKFNRLLAAISCVHPLLMITACRLYNWTKATFGFETRNSV